MAAKYVVQNCPTDLSWAVSGRSHAKLTTLVDDIRAINVDRRAPGVVVADSNDLEALVSLARLTKVVVSFAGPFALYVSLLGGIDRRYGSNLVQACAENGTHYADITGESPWFDFPRSKSNCRIRELIQRHHLKPASSPSIIIPSCGFVCTPLIVLINRTRFQAI